MFLWKLCLIAGLAFLIIEMFAPLTFFLSLAIGAFVAALAAFLVADLNITVTVFAIVSLISLFAFKPFLANRHTEKKEMQTGVLAKYISAVAKATSPINQHKGTISIYGERWEARSLHEEDFPEGSDVRIVKLENLIVYVEKL